MSKHTPGPLADKPLTEMTDLEMLAWAQERTLPLINACPDDEARANGLFALGFLVGTTLRLLRDQERRKAEGR